jgi:hypothetical protein
VFFEGVAAVFRDICLKNKALRSKSVAQKNLQSFGA